MISPTSYCSVLFLLLLLLISEVQGESRIKAGGKEAELEKKWGFDVLSPNLLSVSIS
jgi:hypothetical protein